MMVRNDCQIKQVVSWEQIKFRLNENLFKNNRDKSTLNTTVSCLDKDCFADELSKPAGNLFEK